MTTSSKHKRAIKAAAMEIEGFLSDLGYGARSAMVASISIAAEADDRGGTGGMLMVLREFRARPKAAARKHVGTLLDAMAGGAFPGVEAKAA